ncbi:MAG TPA: hypothetical protein DCE44_02525, partial [Verrucomicrobiales bacterium]|nr:hypothetical protein [Verrucomicrobiales bacterium]
LAAAGGTNNLSAFGLEGSAITVKLETTSDQPIIFQLGGPTPLGSQFYFRRVGADGVYTADEAFLASLPRTADYWRDRGLFDLRGRSFDRIEVRGKTPFTAVREPDSDAWRLTKPLSARADGPRIEALVNALQSTRVAAFVTDSPIVDLEPLGLQPPDTELILGAGTNDLVRLQFGKTPTNAPEYVLVRRLAQTNLVLVPVEAGMLMKLPLANFRDRQLTPSLDGTTEVRIRAGDATVRAIRRGTNWTVVEPETFAADPNLMIRLLQQLSGLEIVDFPNDVPADLARYGLDRPRREFSVLAGTNELVRLQFGNNHGTDKVFVRRGDETSIYATPLAELLRLPEVASQLRDLHFAPTNVVEVVIEQKGRQRTLSRKPAGQWTVTTGANGPLLDEAINETLYRLGQVESTRYVLADPKQLELLKFSEVAHTVTFRFKPGSEFSSIKLQFGGRNPVNNLLALARFDENSQPVLFEFPGTLYEDVLRDFSAP